MKTKIKLTLLVLMIFAYFCICAYAVSKKIPAKTYQKVEEVKNTTNSEE